MMAGCSAGKQKVTSYRHHAENYNSNITRWDWDKHSDWGGMAPGIESKIVA